MSSPYVSIDQLAEYFGVSVSSIRVWVRKNKIDPTTYIRVGTTYRFHLKAVEDSLLHANKHVEMTDAQLSESIDSDIDNIESGIQDKRPIAKRSTRDEDQDPEFDSAVEALLGSDDNEDL